MKITKYFLSSQKSYNQLGVIVSEAETDKNNFLNQQSKFIGEIDREELQIITTQNESRIQAIITLTYFPKSL